MSWWAQEFLWHILEVLRAYCNRKTVCAEHLRVELQKWLVSDNFIFHGFIRWDLEINILLWDVLLWYKVRKRNIACCFKTNDFLVNKYERDVEGWVVFPGGSDHKLPAMQKTHFRSLGPKGPLEKVMAIHSSVLAWRIPWTKKPGRLQSIALQRVRTPLSL